MLATYITLFNKEHGEDNIDAIPYRSSMFGGERPLALLLHQGKASGYDISMHKTQLFQAWWDRELTPRMLNFSDFQVPIYDELSSVNAIVSEYTAF